MPRPRRLLLLGSALALSAAPAGGVVLYDTYAAGQGEPDRLVGKPPDTSGNLQYADPFVSPGTYQHLESITLGLFHPSGATGEFRVFFRADNAGRPGTILEEWVLTDEIFDEETDVELVSVEQPPITGGATTGSTSRS